ncbi:MAG: 3-deoxy-D-manno-octulosonic acid transferase [Prevotella sp.]|nr:3-deoxy-D-manno-octulosonic acid transferase [Prevotella sp.]
MYNLGIYLYLLGVAIVSLFNEKVRKMWRGERDAIRVLREKVDPTAQYVWFHAASLGEFEQGRPLMEQMRREHPEYKILLTFFSPSGYEVRKNYEGADIICYLPLDTISNARRFLRAVRPVMAFFIKYEFWYNYLHILSHRGVPVYSVSSIFRPGQIFFRWYGRQYAHVLKCFTHFYVQNETSRDLLRQIGISAVTVVGDTRFDRVLQIKAAAKQLPVVEEFLNPTPGGGCFVAGSSWQPDEEIFIPWLNEHPDWKVIIAPHVIGEDHLQQIEKLLAGRKVLRYSAASDKSLTSYDVLIIDCFGLLSSIYRYADVAYVGGGFGVGIHNLPEAAVWDVPVIFGPNNQRFQEAQGLKACGGGLEIGNADDFRRIMQGFVTEPSLAKELGEKAGQYVKGRAGATAKILSDVKLSSSKCSNSQIVNGQFVNSNGIHQEL